jgi:glycopeptide antibiotics resistance protein
MNNKTTNRSRFLYFFYILITVFAGLASRRYAVFLPAWVKLYAGDAIWALMVFFLIAFLFKRKSTLWVAGVALLFSFGIEFSQLYHASWIDTIRATRIGGLILGFGFLWSDLVCYTIGIGFGCLFESLGRKHK